MALILIIFFILINALLAFSEMSVVTARKSKLQHMADNGNAHARIALDYSKAPGKVLSTIQVGITLMAIISGAVGEAAFTQQLSEFIQSVPFFAVYHDIISFVVIAIGITLVSLVFGELVPKRLALLNPEKTALLVARPLMIMQIILSPIVWGVNICTEYILKLIPGTQNTQSSVTEDEIRSLVREATKIGVFDSSEEDLVHKVLLLDDIAVGSLMTSRHALKTILATLSIQETVEYIEHHEHDRYPVIDKHHTIVGFVLMRDIITALNKKHVKTVSDVMNKPLLMPAVLPALKAVEEFRDRGIDTAFITDETGMIQGMVTEHDILRAIIGKTRK